MACPSYSRAAPSSEALQLTELDASYSKLPAELLKATANMELVVGLLDSSRALPINNVLPASTAAGRASARLRSVRSSFVSKVGIFRHGIMPASAEVVNNLHNFLEHMDDKEEFIELARVGEVSKMCEDYAGRAEAVRLGYELLAADLGGLSREIEDGLKQIQLDTQQARHELEQASRRSGFFQMGSLSFVSIGLIAGACLAAALLGPGGLLFAPALAGPALTACATAGVGAASVSYNISRDSARQSTVNESKLAVINDALNRASNTLPRAVELFGDAMTALAEFFSVLHADVARIRDKAARTEARLRDGYEEKAFTALYKIFQRNARKVMDLCEKYQKFVARMNISMNMVEAREDRCSLSYIEQWFVAQAQRQPQQHHQRALMRLSEMSFRRDRAVADSGSAASSRHY